MYLPQYILTLAQLNFLDDGTEASLFLRRRLIEKLLAVVIIEMQSNRFEMMSNSRYIVNGHLKGKSCIRKRSS